MAKRTAAPKLDAPELAVRNAARTTTTLALCALAASCAPDLIVLDYPPDTHPPATELLAVETPGHTDIFAVELPGLWKFPSRLSAENEIHLSALIYPGSFADNNLASGTATSTTQGALRSDYRAYTLQITGGTATPWRTADHASPALEPYRLRLHLRALATGLGERHTCLVTREGKLYCWGDNNFGQIGKLGVLASDHPVEVPGVADVEQATLGLEHTCVRARDGRVACFGRNQHKQLARDIAGDTDPVPAEIPGVDGAQQLEAGGNYTCALDKSGHVSCWGAYFDLVQNDGSAAPVPFPMRVERITVGTYGVCGLIAGEVFCAGHVTRLNIPAVGCTETQRFADTPEHVDLPGRVLDVVLGDSVACALLDTPERELHCWGCNTVGQLGLGTRSDEEPVTKILANVRDFDLGWWFGCAVLLDGSTVCWGNNDRGQIGSGGVTSDMRMPTRVSGLETAPLHVRTYWVHACALTAGGDVACWGEGRQGQLGNGGTTSSPMPVSANF